MRQRQEEMKKMHICWEDIHSFPHSVLVWSFMVRFRGRPVGIFHNFHILIPKLNQLNHPGINSLRSYSLFESLSLITFGLICVVEPKVILGGSSEKSLGIPSISVLCESFGVCVSVCVSGRLCIIKEQPATRYVLQVQEFENKLRDGICVGAVYSLIKNRATQFLTGY